MKIVKIFDSYILILFLGFSCWGINPVLALEDDLDGNQIPMSDDDSSALSDQIMDLNSQIMNLSYDEWDVYGAALADASCESNITVLHNHFMDILGRYKPYKVSWNDYNPIKNFKVTPGDEEQLGGLLKAVSSIKDQLTSVLQQMKDNISNCTPKTYDFTNYVYTTIPVYTYVYHDYSDYYLPLLWGAGAWGLWGWGNVWGNGWGWGWNHWHRHHGWRHAGHHGGAHARSRTGTHSGTGTGTHSGTRAGTYTGTRTGTYSGTRTGMYSGTRTGMHSGTRAGTHSGTRTGTHSGIHAGTHSGTRHGGTHSGGGGGHRIGGGGGHRTGGSGGHHGGGGHGGGHHGGHR